MVEVVVIVIEVVDIVIEVVDIVVEAVDVVVEAVDVVVEGVDVDNVDCVVWVVLSVGTIVDVVLFSWQVTETSPVVSLSHANAYVALQAFKQLSPSHDEASASPW